MVNAPQIAAGVASVCLVLAIAWLATSDFPVVDPGKPTTKAGPVLILEAAVPAIGEFTEFNVNHDNPFLPYNIRIEEINTIRTPQTVPRPPSTLYSADVPKIILPKLGAVGPDAPKATGVLLSHDLTQAFLTYPGETRATLLKPGDSVKGWTLVSVIGTNIVRVKDDATGVVHALVIAETANEPRGKADGKEGKEGKEVKDPKKGPAEKDADGKKPAERAAQAQGAKTKSDGQAEHAQPDQYPATEKPGESILPPPIPTLNPPRTPREKVF